MRLRLHVYDQTDDAMLQLPSHCADALGMRFYFHRIVYISTSCICTITATQPGVMRFGAISIAAQQCQSGRASISVHQQDKATVHHVGLWLQELHAALRSIVQPLQTTRQTTPTICSITSHTSASCILGSTTRYCTCMDLSLDNVHTALHSPH